MVVLASGGVDSAVLLARAQRDGSLAGVVWCNYGQPASLHEWRAMRAQLKALEVSAPLHEVPLTTVSPGAMTAPTGEPGPRIVPARNLVMLAHAVNYAATIGADEVWYGANFGDAREYHDCRPAWVDALNACISGDGVRVLAPLSGLTKPEILTEAVESGLMSLAWSCYSPRFGKPCGTCGSCVELAQAEAQGDSVLGWLQWAEERS